MGDTAPLISREPKANLAWLWKEKSPIISADLFLTQVKFLAEQLPNGQHVINLCDDRYNFLVSLCAVVYREQTNLFPSNKNLVTQNLVKDRYKETYIVHDGVVELAEGIKQLDLSKLEWPTYSEYYDVPNIKLEHVAAISFTSGSTGNAKPNIKTWRTLVESTAINVRYMLPNNEATFYHLATVPGQHMWGLETSVLMTLFAKVCLVNSRPLFPHDVIEQLAALPESRTLITTPLHLRAINSSNNKLPRLTNILSATAPLNAQLAKEIEQKSGAEVREVYGCSEVGSIAIRRTAQTEIWEKFSELEFNVENNHISVSANHLPCSVALEDELEIINKDQFRLQGRAADQINIAGKRGSLDEVNKVLMSFPGLKDGVVFLPPQSSTVARLAALVVLAEGFYKDHLKEHFRKHLDAVFVPRPIIQVEELPREDNGKLTKTKLLEFYQTQKV